MKQKWTIAGFLVLIIVVPVGLARMIIWSEHKYAALPVLERAADSAGAVEFVNQFGAVFSSKQWEGHVVVAHCFFTHCTVVCPKMIMNLKQLNNDQDVLICSISVDPERDSARQLEKYALRFDISDNWMLLTGAKKDIYRFLRKNLQLVATDGDGGPQDFIHSENLVLIDTRGRVRGYYRGTKPEEIDRLKDAIKKLTR